MEDILARAEKAGVDETTGLVVPIQWHDGEDFPPEAKAMKPDDFKECAFACNAFKDTRGYVEYEARLKKFVHRVRIKTMFPNTAPIGQSFAQISVIQPKMGGGT